MSDRFMDDKEYDESEIENLDLLYQVLVADDNARAHADLLYVSLGARANRKKTSIAEEFCKIAMDIEVEMMGKTLADIGLKNARRTVDYFNGKKANEPNEP